MSAGGLFVGAAIFALGAFGVLTAFLILVLAEAMPAWAAALVVLALYGAVAALLAFFGRKRWRRAQPLVPTTEIRQTVGERPANNLVRKGSAGRGDAAGPQTDDRDGEGGHRMGKASDEIRGEIEDTRERMTETADAIRYRADVKSRTKEAVAEKKDSLVDKAGSAVSRVTGKMPSPGDVASEAGDMASNVGDAASSAASRVGDALPDTDQVKRQARQAVSVAQENPIGLAVGSIAVGFLAGMLIPRTQMEDERIGELSDQVKEQARGVGREARRPGPRPRRKRSGSARRRSPARG